MAKDILTKTTGTLYAEVTDRIIAQLEAGRVPWVQPWDGSKLESGLPRNAGTGRRYSGINVLILWGTLFERGFGTQGWLTYKQAQALGGNVRKGETGTTICYADRFTPKDEREKPITDASDEHRRQVAFLKRFTVFNVDQCEGLPDALSVGGRAFLGERETIECAEALMTATGAQMGIGGDKAFCMPTADRIQLPPQQTFHDQVNFYRTALNEMGHNAASRIMPDEGLQGANFLSFCGSVLGIIFVKLASGLRAISSARAARFKGADLKTLNMSGFLLALRTWPRSDRADRVGKDIRIMPNARKEDLTEAARFGTPLGIIRNAALWPLCRIRHNGHWTGHPTRLDRDQKGPPRSASYAREELVALSGQSVPPATLQ